MYLQQINNNGPISFQRRFSEFSPERFPSNQPILLVPFWDDLDNEIAGSTVSYRLTTNSSDLQQARTDVLEAQFTGLEDFTPTYLLIATWYQVPLLGQTIQVNFEESLVYPNKDSV